MPAFCCFGDPARTVELVDAGWSSPVARQAHNLKVVGSNPTPATNKKPASLWDRGLFCSPSAWRPKRPADRPKWGGELRSEEHTSELQSLMRISYAVFCLKQKKVNESKYTPRFL